MAHAGLGPFLKEARERAGMTLDELARRTRIRRQNLESLELGDWEALPSELYVRGFVKLVCRELGLAPETALRMYEESRRETGSAEETVWAEERTVPEPGWLERVLREPEQVLATAARAGRWAAWGVCGVVVLLLALWIGRRWERPADSGDAGVEVAAEQSTPPRAEPPERTTPIEAELPEREEVPAVEPPPAVEPQSKSEEKTERVAATEVGEEETEPAVVREPPAATPDAEREPRVIEGPRPAADERLTLRIEALREVRVSLLLDGVGHPRRRTLAKGETKTWKADSLFLLSTDDAGAIRLTLSGEDLGLAGADGQRLERVAIRASRP